MRRIIILAAFCIFLASLYSGCQSDEFIVNRVANENDFTIAYINFNTTDFHTMDFEADDSVDVLIESTGGIIDIIITNPEELEIYRANDAQSGEFRLIFHDPGTYRFVVSGKQARGYVSFKGGSR